MYSCKITIHPIPPSHLWKKEEKIGGGGERKRKRWRDPE